MSRTFPNTILKVVRILKCDVCEQDFDSEDAMREHIKGHYMENTDVKVTRNRRVNKSVMDSKMIRCQNLNIEAPQIDFDKMIKHNTTVSRFILCDINGCGAPMQFSKEAESA